MAHPQVAETTHEERRPRILSLDNGGVRCLSSLYILETIMEDVQIRDGLPEVPRPCDYFDLICGSGFGGLIAILLGRLHTTVADCIKILLQFPVAKKRAFFPSRPRHDNDEVRHFILRAIEGQGLHAEAEFSREEGHCRTLVLAMSPNSMLFPVHLRSYDSRMDRATRNCRIWQAALASIADIDTSDSVLFGNPPVAHYSATFSYSNPSKEVLDEATRIWQADAIQVFVSVGAGMLSRPSLGPEPSNSRVLNYSQIRSRMKLFAQWATDTEVVAEMVRRDARILHFDYLRFNVPDGLDSVDAGAWGQEGLSIVQGFTAQYLKATETREKIVYCAGRVSNLSPGVDAPNMSVNQPHIVQKDFLIEVGSEQAATSFDVATDTALENSAIVRHVSYVQPRKTDSLQYGTYQGNDEPSDFRSSDDWFKELYATTHPLVKSGWKRNDPVVKIAILDTGYDGQHPYLKGNPRIVAQKSFLAGFDKANEDDSGHGTHSTALLLKVAPHAKLCVARIAKDYDSDIAVKSVVEAIDWAVQNKADIISMSFGYPNVIDEIGAAIVKAWNSKVIVLAAASNGGGNNVIDIAFPARMNGMVICVNSTDGKGSPSKNNPPASNERYNFSTLGEAVLSAWPLHLDPSGQKRCWGTSTATPIAAAIAALIIGFAQQRVFDLDAVHISRLKTFQGMQQLFIALGNMKDGYRYIVPWKLLRPTRYLEDIRGRIRQEVDSYYGSLD